MADPVRMWGRPSRRLSEERVERLWRRYWSIVEDKGTGLYTPILWHLALRGDAGAMNMLADTFALPGRIADGFSKAGLNYRAYRLGYAFGAQHLAMSAFNRRDLKGYRYWLRRGAGAGDPDCAAELGHFETRLPHQAAREIGRHRPVQRRDGYARRAKPLPVLSRG